jgi:3-dehydroquinate synthetase
VLEQYGLPTHAAFKTEKVFQVLKMDKKRVRSEMNYILLEKIGKGIILPVPLKELEKWINNIQS